MMKSLLLTNTMPTFESNVVMLEQFMYIDVSELSQTIKQTPTHIHLI